MTYPTPTPHERLYVIANVVLALAIVVTAIVQRIL